MRKKVLLVNYFLMLGGGEKLLIELVDFCLDNNMQPEVLITDNFKPRDNIREEHYDAYLRSKGVKIHRVPVFHKTLRDMIPLVYWRCRLKFSSLFYSSVHVVNLLLADRLYEILKNKKRVYWHITNNIQFENAQYPYRQLLVSNPGDTIVTINKFQLPELREYFKIIKAGMVDFKLFLNK